MQSDLQLRSPARPPAPQRDAAVQPTAVDVLRIVRRRFWVILLILAAAVLAALYLTRRTPPTWRAHAQLILVEHSGNVAVSPQAGYSLPTVETIDTQLTMLQDHEMARRAMTLLTGRLQAQGQSPEALGLTAERIERAITVSTPHDTDVIDVFVDSDSPQKAALLGNAVCDAFTGWKKEVAQRNSEDALTNLEVRANRAKDALDQAERRELDFKKAHHLVDAAAQSSGLLGQSQAADSSAVSLQGDLITEQTRLRSLGGQLNTLDRAIRGGTGVRDDTLVLGLQSQLSQLEIDRANAALRVRAKYPAVLGDLDAKIKDIQGRLGKAVQGTLDNKKPSLQAQGTLFGQYKQAQVAVLIAQSKLDAARKVQADLKRQMAALPEINQASARLGHDADLARSLYGTLEAGLDAARLEKDMVSGNVQVLQAADVPDAPAGPSLLRNLMVGAAVGLALAVFAVMLLEHTDRRVHGLDGLIRMGGGNPIVGVLPRMSGAEMAALRRGEMPQPVLEAFNLAGINLDLLMRHWEPPAVAARLPSTGPEAFGGRKADGNVNGAAFDPGGTTSFPSTYPDRIILVTSTLPGEGKSMTSASLARALARSGKRVILVNADMRRPALDQAFPASGSLGLADVLERRASLADALERSDEHNLLVLHSGQVTDSPTNLLSRPALAHLIHELRSAGCTVLIDTPASAVVGDALLLAPHADGILHVVGVGQVEEEILGRTTAALHAAAPGVLAYFVNRLPHERRAAYGGYYRPFAAAAAPATNAQTAAADGQGARSVASLWDEAE